MRYIVHVGRHKTGTTSLQRRLAESGAVLARNGVLYPSTGRRRFGHHEMAEAIKTSVPIAEEIRREVDGIKPETVIVSSEALQNVDPVLLAQVFPPAHTTVVIYLREQVDYLLSAYAQRVQATDLCVPFEEFVKPHLRNLDYLGSLRRFEKSFGRKHLEVRVYDRGTLVGGSTLSDFLAVTGLDQIGIDMTEDTDANPSLDFHFLALKLMLNGLGIAHRPESKNALYRLLQDALQQPGARGPRLSVSNEFQAAVRQRFAKDNLRLFSTYIRNGNEQFPLRDLSNHNGQTQPADLRLVFDMADRWISAGGRELIAGL